MTRLRKWISPKTGRLKRIYVERGGLRAKLWFEPAENNFEVHFYGNEADFSVLTGAGEPAHIREAREALHDVGLDLNQCTWNDIANKAVS